MRETWQESEFGFLYKATDDYSKGFKWKPSLFMPKKACRLFLKIKNVRIEKLNDITDLDAIDEGVITLTPDWVHKQFPDYSKAVHEHAKLESIHKPPLGPTPVMRFQKLWQSINGEKSWADNPWVWVVEFEPIKPPKEFLS